MADVFVRKAEFLRSEQERRFRRREMFADESRSGFEPVERNVQIAMSNGRCAHHRASIRRWLRRAWNTSGLAPECIAISRRILLPGTRRHKALTRRMSRKPKLLMARAAAPILSGLRGETRTIRSGSANLLLQVRVALQPVFVELQQTPGFLVAKTLLSHGALDVFAKLIEQRIARCTGRSSRPRARCRPGQRSRGPRRRFRQA